MGRTSVALIAAGAGLMLALSACGANTQGGGGGGGGATSGGAGGAGVKVGVILPDTASSARYESFDRPLLDKALRAEGLDPDIQNAQGDVQKFSQLADGMINSGVKVLIIDSLNSESGAAVAKKAQASGIPVIDYDRLNLGGSSDYYVSFDATKIGEVQGQGLLLGVGEKQGANIIEIEGAATDNNATLVINGQKNVLKSKYDSGAYKVVGSQQIPEWNNQQAGTTFEQLLTANGGKVDGVLVANDGMAGAVVTVLKKTGLAGKVPVTGQDATPDGLQAILRGEMFMTVFKPITEEANATAKVAAALAKGDKAGADKLATATADDTKNGRKVKSVLLNTVLITKDKVKQVVDAGGVKASEICVADTKAACDQLGIK
ncbi:sugar ABC transporter substrate-binding protein [Pseudonocardia acaciae]|uniref:sugar ABC transporter substrate-binding protein n=1 Tax=Pseudonocardia acaciae TaxID=551276 RepID=UPI0004919403|nr:substrate-binding domain-containing protein [Pseudonocardia acaciae]